MNHHLFKSNFFQFQNIKSSSYDFWIALGTLGAVIVALFGERFWKLIEGPRIKIEFDKDSERCFRWAIATPNIQDEGVIRNVKKYYFRLKITNTGGVAKKLRVRADIKDKNGNEVERFEPSTLRWINGKEETDLLRGESEYVNLLSQLVDHPEIRNRLTIEISDNSPRGIAWDRKLDIYKYSVTVYGENINPVSIHAKFTPNHDITKPGNLILLYKL